MCCILGIAKDTAFHLGKGPPVHAIGYKVQALRVFKKISALNFSIRQSIKKLPKKASVNCQLKTRVVFFNMIKAVKHYK